MFPKATANTAKKLFLLIISLWTIVAAASLLNNYFNGQKTAHDLALNSARSSYNKDILFRQWISSHGGVHVPITTRTPPNSYLTEIENRDITTDHNIKLTLINPAYMMRQLTTENNEYFPIRTHITSLNPINPINSPDNWERKILTKLDKLTRDNLDHEVHELDTRSEPTLRYLKPMLVAESCLKCHKSQGYSLNDIRGAITVYVPMQNFLNAQAEQFKSTLFFHLIIWLIVPCAVYPFYKSLVKEADQSHQLNTELTDLNKSLDQKVIQRTKEIEKMATTDSLTGLKNRRCLRNIVNSELKRALRNKKTFVVAMFDIDNFKNYNDHYGHHQGDLALQSFAKIVKESLRRPADQAFRMGGEEFLICYTSDELSKIPELPLRILNSLQQQAIPNGKKVLTVSIGLTSCQPETTEINYEQLYKQADEALYIAKNNGKNQLRVYQSASTKKETNGTLLTSST